MRGDDTRLHRHTEAFELFDRMTHDGPVAVAAHDHTDFRLGHGVPSFGPRKTGHYVERGTAMLPATADWAGMSEP